MTEPRYHLAQLNIAYMLAPLDDPIMADFVAQLDYVNAVADRAAGFVWRLQSDEGDATAFRFSDDDTILVNMSVWESLEALHDYVYRSDHLGVLRDRKRWFHKSRVPTLVLWWVPAGHHPTLEEARARLELLQANGPTEDAFSFKQWFPPPGATDAELHRFDYTGCDSGS